MKRLAIILGTALCLGAPPVGAQFYAGGKAPVADVWKPAATPKGGVPWKLLESTKETTRNKQGIIYSKPVFTPQVQALSGKQIRVSGYMMPLTNGAKQKRFVLLAYPPGCPFHFHALPNQFIEVIAATPFKLNETDPLVVTGTLQLTGQDESGIFYRIVGAIPG